MSKVKIPNINKYSTFGERLKYLRLVELKMTQSQFADLLNLNRTLITAYEKNTFPKADKFVYILECLNEHIPGFNPNWLFGQSKNIIYKYEISEKELGLSPKAFDNMLKIKSSTIKDLINNKSHDDRINPQLDILNKILEGNEIYSAIQNVLMSQNNKEDKEYLKWKTIQQFTILTERLMKKDSKN